MGQIRVKALKYDDGKLLNLPFRVFPGDYLRIDEKQFERLRKLGLVREVRDQEFERSRTRRFKSGFKREG